MGIPKDLYAFPFVAGGEACTGMTLRDWFAGQAMGTVVALLGRDVGTADALAKDAYTLADAMLAARQEPAA